MRQLLISTISLLVLSIALSACSSNKSSGGGRVNKPSATQVPESKTRTIETSHANTPTDFSTLTSFADDDRKNTKKDNNALKIGSLVQLTSSGGKIKNDRITGGVVQFSYDETTGDFADNGLKLYFSDKEFTISTGGTGDAESVNSSVVNVGDWLSPTKTVFDLNRNGFNFIANHMVNLTWNIVDSNSGYNSVNYGVAGFETVNIPLTGNYIFKGAGAGTYSDGTKAIGTNFNMIAVVDFAGLSVVLSSSNTQCTTTDVCANEARPHLNFSGDLSYKFGENLLISTDKGIATNGDADNASISGIADARFYGVGSDSATELGGTFRLSNSKDDYIGWFGSKFEEEYFASDALIANTNHAELNGKIVPSKPLLHADFEAAVDDGTESIFTMKAFGFSANKTTDYTRTSNTDPWGAGTAQDTIITRSDDAVVDVSFDEGKISGVTIYVGDKKYEGGETMGSPTAIGYLAGITGTNYTTTQLLLDRVAVFGSFESKYMAYLRWIVERGTQHNLMKMKPKIVAIKLEGELWLVWKLKRMQFQLKMRLILQVKVLVIIIHQFSQMLVVSILTSLPILILPPAPPNSPALAQHNLILISPPLTFNMPKIPITLLARQSLMAMVAVTPQ